MTPTPDEQLLLDLARMIDHAAGRVKCKCDLSAALSDHEVWCWKARLESALERIREQVGK